MADKKGGNELGTILGSVAKLLPLALMALEKGGHVKPPKKKPKKAIRVKLKK